MNYGMNIPNPPATTKPLHPMRMAECPGGISRVEQAEVMAVICMEFADDIRILDHSLYTRLFEVRKSQTGD